MKAWRQTLVGVTATVRDAIQRIDAGSMQIAVVVDEAGRLVGTTTDGDVRRALLRGVSLDASVREVMNPSPTRALEDKDRDSLLALMQSRGLHQVPIVNGDGVVVGLEVIDDLLKPPQRGNWVVLMAGGLGARLRPLTDARPKPMLAIGDRPILQHIVEAFVKHGYHRFFMAVNYLGGMIEEHFRDGEQWEARIEYLREQHPLGTAGALSLLPERPTEAFFAMNGDLLTTVNFENLLQFHLSHHSTATICVREFEYQIPYGVVVQDGHKLLAIEEKPKQRHFVSAGIYLLAPEVLDFVEPDHYLDMPSLFERLVSANKTVTVFPIREYWRDIGQHEDFERANGDFRNGLQ